MIKTGLYFGSFNPVHIGHLAIAGYLTEYSGLDQVWFVVSPHNPLKKKESLLDDRQRLYMVQLGIGDNDHLRASDIEFKLTLPSYTVNTLQHLKEKHPGHEFFLVMGEDNLYTLHKWKNANEIVRNHKILVYPRAGVARPPLPQLDKILEEADIKWVNAPLMEISGTFIRNGIRTGKDMSFFLPPKVWKYIREMHFYRKPED
ncbi:MAG TPA: nicotinate (nicotinamide) nucleotide adenylyltransferase [Bacteroidales bacterium]|nr:nicotinate (nicotinamide) nucleotide adenylyltransferase [Bacteroidales bacterium]